MLTIIDVSMWQGEVNWARVAQDGIRLAYVKATQGDHSRDPQLERNRREAEAHGIRVGCYAYVEPGASSPEAQAANLAHAIGALRRRELRPVQDLELGSPDAAAAFARPFTQAVRRLLGVTPIFYSYSAFTEQMGLAKPVGGGLWLASYGRNDGRDYGAAIPKPWRSWVAHQYTSVGHADGIAGRVDLSHAPRLRPLLAHPIRGLA